MPPNVAGWDDERWLDTATFRGRWWVANYATQPYSLTDKQAAALPAEPAGARRSRDRRSGAPPRFARPRARRCSRSRNRAMGDANAKWKQTSYRFLTANALRQLIAVSPDLQTS